MLKDKGIAEIKEVFIYLFLASLSASLVHCCVVHACVTCENEMASGVKKKEEHAWQQHALWQQHQHASGINASVHQAHQAHLVSCVFLLYQ